MGCIGSQGPDFYLMMPSSLFMSISGLCLTDMHGIPTPISMHGQTQSINHMDGHHHTGPVCLIWRPPVRQYNTHTQTCARRVVSTSALPCFTSKIFTYVSPMMSFPLTCTAASTSSLSSLTSAPTPPLALKDRRKLRSSDMFPTAFAALMTTTVGNSGLSSLLSAVTAPAWISVANADERPENMASVDATSSRTP